LIEMLEDPALIKVHCETHDDAVLVRQLNSTSRVAEFVQVKGGEADKLWSVADLCRKKDSKPGTSICERSIARDHHAEDATFRVVTLRPVTSELEVLTLQLGTPARSQAVSAMTVLRAALDERLPNLTSPKGNDSGFWLDRCYWDQRHSEDVVRRDNLLRLLKLSAKEGRPLLPESAEVLLDELRAWAKRAGDAKWDDGKEKKIILRETIRAWWIRRTEEITQGVANSSGGKLAVKLQEAGLPDDVAQLAIALRLDFAGASRTSRYSAPDDADRMLRHVRSEVMSLRARFVAGQLDLDGAGFHALCLERMDALGAEKGSADDDLAALLKGCMYDITDRCLLRFARP
jgi:hypothetical protein